MMRARLATWAIALGVLGNSGCGLVANATHTVTSRVEDAVNEVREKHRNSIWAKQAWDNVCAGTPGQPFSEDHERGFKAGFVEYVTYGGTGAPPPLPPKKYHSLKYQTPQGYQAIEDWFAGYRLGVGAAKEGGYRDLVTGPSSLRAAAIHPVVLPPVAELPRPAPVPASAPTPVVPAMPSASPPPASMPPAPTPELPPPTPDPMVSSPIVPAIQPVAAETPQTTDKRPFVVRISINWDPWNLWSHTPTAPR